MIYVPAMIEMGFLSRSLNVCKVMMVYPGMNGRYHDPSMTIFLQLKFFQAVFGFTKINFLSPAMELFDNSFLRRLRW